MRKTYASKADYDEDYHFVWAPINEPLAPAKVEFLGGRSIRVTPIWARPKVGGHLTFEGTGAGYTLGVGNAAPVGTPHPSRIESIVGDVITLEAASFEARVISTTEAMVSYHVPRMMLPGTNPAIMRRVWRPVWERILSVLEGLSSPLLPSHTIVLVGCGYGWECELISEIGGHAVVGVETSRYVHDTKGASYEPTYRAELSKVGLDPDVGEGAAILAGRMQKSRTEATILDIDVSLPLSRQAIEVALGGRVDWAISSFVLSILDDAEAVAMDAGMRALATNVAHYTNTGRNEDGSATERQDPRFNWKSMMGWKALLAPSVIITSRFEVV